MKQINSPSYMELRLDLEGRVGALYLRVPTFWDAVRSQWMGALKMSDGKLVMATGKDSFELQNNFNVELYRLLQDPVYQDETFNMFKSLEFWESNEEKNN